MTPKAEQTTLHALPPISLILGWAADHYVWLDWVEANLSKHFQVHLINLPKQPQWPCNAQLLAHWQQDIIEQLPRSSHLIGWSLGGMLAQSIAHQQPQKVLSLTNLCATPRFVQQADWQEAVIPQNLEALIEQLQTHPEATIKHFWKLQLQGSEQVKQHIKRFNTLVSAHPLPNFSVLQQGLYLLKTINNRSLVQQLPCPTLWLLGQHDPLVPSSLQARLSQTPPSLSQVEIITGAGHMPFFTHPEQTAEKLITFIQTAEVQNAHPNY